MSRPGSTLQWSARAGNRGGGFADLLMAAAALAEELPLVTRSSKDFEGPEDLVIVVQV
jgi:predicted nucleic acid-binding protein